jgi:hypothetical protein
MRDILLQRDEKKMNAWRDWHAMSSSQVLLWL